ncbi:MAG TPA: hypothetical protein VGE07_13180 [Herpetosiphonaceae bacterium]
MSDTTPGGLVSRWKLGSLAWGLLIVAMMTWLALFGLGLHWVAWGALMVGFGNSFVAAWRFRKRPEGNLLPFALHGLALALYVGLAFSGLDVRIDFSRTSAARDAIAAGFASDPEAVRNSPSVATTGPDGESLWSYGPVESACAGADCALLLLRADDFGVRRGYVYAPADKLPASIGGCELVQSTRLAERWFWAYCNPE